MANLVFFVQHESSLPVKIKTHFDALGAPRADPLTDAADVTEALAPRFAAAPSDELSLRLPAAVPRASSGLGAACFFSEESESDSTLDPGCALAALLALGVSSKRPLRVVVKSNNNQNTTSGALSNASGKVNQQNNTILFVQYLNNQPVGIRTHQLITASGEWIELFLVTDVISAFFPALSPVDLGQITLHLPSSLTRRAATASGVAEDCFLNERDVALRPGCRLSELSAVGNDDRNPFIISSQSDTITMDEYMASSLPQPVYDNPVSKPNSSGSHWKKPAHVLHWPGFEAAVNDWIKANHVQHLQRIEPPVFVPRTITEEVQSLQPFILDNLLSVSSKCFIPQTEFKAIRQIVSCVGNPDHLMTRDGEIVALAEEKGKWTLLSDDIVTDYTLNTPASKSLSQLYHYMRLNHRKYGILTSYEYTWFVYRSQVCDICQDPPQGHETLFSSRGIAYNHQNPTPLQCMAYFNSLVNSENMSSPPPSQRPSRSSSASSVPRPVHSISSRRGGGSSRGSLYHGSASSPLSNQSSSSSSSGEGGDNTGTDNVNSSTCGQEFVADDFNFNSVLGEGKSKVYLETYNSVPVALKVADIAKNPKMLPELLNEVSIYEDLCELQGSGIPKFMCHGSIEDVLYCIGISVCGSCVETLDAMQKEILVGILERIHQAGILHNDIRKENILVDESGNPVIIDFGFASRSVSVEEQLEEKNKLIRLIEQDCL